MNDALADLTAEGSLHRRWAFLVGEGTLTVAEVVTWAQELVPGPLPLPAEVSFEDRLYVARGEP